MTKSLIQTNIKNKIYNIVKKIPRGKVMTYGQIAKMLGIRDVRLVGWMLHQNKDQKVPCHRVIRSDGTCAKGYAFGGRSKQRNLLEKEGVVFKNNQLLDMARVLFQAPSLERV